MDLTRKQLTRERATWTVRRLADPLRHTARPGADGSSRAASGASMTSSESLRSRSRSAMRRLTLALMSALTIPAGRWVASTRWTPRLRPTAATRTSPVTNEGSSSASTRNSSMITTSRASAGSTGWSTRLRL